MNQEMKSPNLDLTLTEKMMDITPSMRVYYRRVRRRLQGTRSVVYFVSSSMDYPSFGDNPGKYPWSIHCVDLQSEFDSSSLQPKVRICDASFECPAFCIFESTLYVFQGRMVKCEGRSIYAYKLKPEDSGLNLSKSMMMEVGQMNNVKYSPMAVATPKGRSIIVYSLLATLDFEMFDPGTGKCKELPKLNCIEGSMIFSCAFVSDYVLLVQTKRGRQQQSFTLDLIDCQSWKECLKPDLQHHYLIFAKDVCLTPIAGYFLSEDADKFDEFLMGWYLYPEISLMAKDKDDDEDENFVSSYSGITLIEDEDEYGSCQFCILNLALEKSEEKMGGWPIYTPHMALDVYKCDLNVCRQEMKRMNDLKMGAEYSGENEWRRWEGFTLPGATKIKSLRLCLQPQIYDHLTTLFFSSYSTPSYINIPLLQDSLLLPLL